MDATIIRPADPRDASPIAAIYACYVHYTLATFEIDPPSAAEITTRIAQSIVWFVCETAQDDELIGYAYARPFESERPAYGVAIGIRVCLHHDSRWMRRGIERRLVTTLIDAVRAISCEGALGTQRYRQALAIQATPLAHGEPEDRTSGAFYRALGFQHAGALHKVGYKLGTWSDVQFWQMDLGS